MPGFFGFADLGDLAYFGHVRDLAVAMGPPLGLEGEIRVVPSEPTASLPRRAALLCEAISALLDEAPGEVHVVGHSRGGLDARLLLTPGAALPTPADPRRCAASVRAVLSVATPHYGTPLAQRFGSMMGHELLRVLSLATIYGLRTGRLPLSVVLRLARLLRRPGARPAGVLDQLFLELLSDFSADRRRAVEEFFSQVGTDQGLLGQITPSGMELFNASTQDRSGVRYGSVAVRARPPGLRSLAKAGLDGYAQATHALFVALYRFASGMPERWLPRLTADNLAVLRRAYGRVPPPEANDGIVPTLSQVWGDLVAAAWADHHDVLGHFHLPRHVPPHFDWLASGTGFDRPRFEALWRSALVWLAGPAGPRHS